MNAEYFQKYFLDLIIMLNELATTTGKKYIIVMENASYHTSSYAPPVRARKQVIIGFLLKYKQKVLDVNPALAPMYEKDIPEMTLVQLRPLLSAAKKKHGFYRIEELAKTHRQVVWRLPPWYESIISSY